MMPGTPEQPTDEDLGWSQVRTAGQLAAITAEIRCPIGLALYVMDDPYPRLLRDGSIDEPRTTVVVVLSSAEAEAGEDLRGLAVIIPSFPTCRTLFGAIMDGLVQMEATDLAADVLLDSWPIFPEGNAVNHSEPILDGSYVDPFDPDAPAKLAGSKFTVGEQGATIVEMDDAGRIRAVKGDQ